MTGDEQRMAAAPCRRRRNQDREMAENFPITTCQRATG
jgi:hypothetical protein